MPGRPGVVVVMPGTLVRRCLCPYSRAAAMAPNRPAPMNALNANARSDCWSASVEMNALLLSISVPAIMANALSAAITMSTATNARGSAPTMNDMTMELSAWLVVSGPHGIHHPATRAHTAAALTPIAA